MSTHKKIGTLVLLGVLLFGVVAFQKDRIHSWVAPGDTIQAAFSRQYKLEDHQSVVKLAGVRVGEVTDVEQRGDGALVTMRIDRGVKAKLGGSPSATVRPTLVLGGVYFVELAPGGRGGEFNGTIPVERTSVPVELDPVLSSINPDAQAGLRGMTRHLDATLDQPGREAIHRFLRETPPYFSTATDVLQSARGTEPDVDLTRLVSGLEGTAAAFTRKDGQLGEILDSLHSTTASLAAQRRPIAAFIGSAPETLRTTRAGLADLSGTLDRLTHVAPNLRDSVRELDPLFAEMRPVISRARPVVSDLRDVLDDAEPLLDDLGPTSSDAADVLTDLRGPVLERVDGPIKDMVMAPWHGTGPSYGGGGNDHPLYQELGYLSAHGAQGFKFYGAHGSLSRLMAGVGVNTPTGSSEFPPTAERLLESKGLNQPPGANDANPNESPVLPLLGGNK